MSETTNEDLKFAFAEHAAHDEAFQVETRGFNGEMAVFRAETEGSLAELHSKVDLLLDKFDPKSDGYAFTKVDLMYAIYEGLGFSRKALMVLGGVMLSIGAIVGGFVTAIRFVK